MGEWNKLGQWKWEHPSRTPSSVQAKIPGHSCPGNRPSCFPCIDQGELILLGRLPSPVRPTERLSPTAILFQPRPFLSHSLCLSQPSAGFLALFGIDLTLTQTRGTNACTKEERQTLCKEERERWRAKTQPLCGSPVISEMYDIETFQQINRTRKS